MSEVKGQLVPISEEQLAANRANAAKSTGPHTPEGKARSAQNAPSHGFTESTFAVVRLEDINEVAHLRADLTTVYQPVNSQDLFALERIALAQQAILCAAPLEAGLFTTCLDAAIDGEGHPFTPAASWRNSPVAKRCGLNYQTNPFWRSNPKKKNPLVRHPTNPFHRPQPPRTPNRALSPQVRPFLLPVWWGRRFRQAVSPARPPFQ